MGRKLFSILAGVSLLLCIGGIVQWLRSNDWMGRITGDISIGHRQLTPAEMALPGNEFPVWHWGVAGFELGKNVRFGWDTSVAEAARTRLPARGITVHGEPSSDLEALYRKVNTGRVELAIRFPYWLLVFLAAPAPLFWWIRHRQDQLRQHRVELGRCPVCGYDLRASPDRCPECGTESETFVAKATKPLA